MKSFIAILSILLLAVLLWLFWGKPDSTINSSTNQTEQSGLSSQQSAASATSGDSTQTDAAAADTATGQQRVASRFSGQQSSNPARRTGQTRSLEGDDAETVADNYFAAEDLAVLYQQLLDSSEADDYYYRYRILKECNDLRLRGIDSQLDTCESIAEHTARGNAANQPGSEESFTASQIAEACFDFTERCSNLDFDNIQETPAEVLQLAIQSGSSLARAANLYQLSSDDPQLGRQWLADALNEDPNSADLLRHGASFLRSAHRLRQQPFYGAADSATLQLAERALDLTACRLDNSCNQGSHFMLERCNYLPGCLPWQSYEQWLYASYAGSPDTLTAVLQLSDDYQQLLINRQAELLIFPELIENDGG